MALEQFFGRIVDVTRRTDGDELTAAAGISETVLSVGDTADFDETGGTVEINGDRYTYSELDHDANTITLDTGLLAAAAVGDRVDVVDEELNTVVVEYVANVELDEQDPGDEPIEVTVQHSLVDYLVESVRGGFSESVTLLRTDPFEEPVIWEIDGKLVENVALEQVKGGYEGTMAALNADLVELNTVTLPAVQADLADNEAAVATLNGLFPITSTSISDGAITTPKMTANSINGDRIIANTLNAAKIVAASITGDRIAANTIGADRIVANSIGADRIAANAITAGKIAAGAIDGMTLTGVSIVAGNWQLSGGGLIDLSTGLQLASDGDALIPGVLSVGDGLTVSTGGADIGGDVHADNLYADAVPTTTDAANCRMSNFGRLLQSSSSKRYKANIKNAKIDPTLVLAAKARTWTSKIRDDKKAPGIGLIAEELDEGGLGAFVEYRDDRPEAVNYDRFAAVGLLVVCQAQQKQIDTLRKDRGRDRAQIDTLTKQVAALTKRLDRLEQR